MSSLISGMVAVFTDLLKEQTASSMELNNAFVALSVDVIRRFVEQEGVSFELVKGDTHYRYRLNGAVSADVSLDSYSVESLSARYKDEDEFVAYIRRDIAGNVLGSDPLKHAPAVAEAFVRFRDLMISLRPEIADKFNNVESDCAADESDREIMELLYQIYKENTVSYIAENEEFEAQIKESYRSHQV